MTPSHFFTTVAGFGLLASCQTTQLDSVAGRHVVIHWDSSEVPLCGGTLEHIDSTLEVMAQTYGLELPDTPNTDILWTGDDMISNACHERWGCTYPFPNGTNIMFSGDPSDPHELMHTITLTGTRLPLPSFFEEGVAVRWELGSPPWSMMGKGVDRESLTHSYILALLEQMLIPGDAYGTAGFLWSWLEAEFGPHAMKEFANRVDIFSSTAKIEEEFEATFGITLKMAIEISRNQPPMAFDLPACFMTDLPKFVWAGKTLMLSTGPSTCAATDVVIGPGGAGRYVRLELDDIWRPYSLEVTGPLFSSTEVFFFACKGEPVPYEDPLALYPLGSDWPIWLRGTYIVVVTTPPDEDGTVPFPVVRLKPVRLIQQ